MRPKYAERPGMPRQPSSRERDIVSGNSMAGATWTNQR